MDFPDSLAFAVDRANEIIFSKQNISPEEKSQLAAYFLSKQLQTGPHAGLFAPTADDLAEGVHLFTGERLHTHLGPRNVLSAETVRTFRLLDLQAADFDGNVGKAQQKLTDSCFAAQFCIVGECAHSAVGFMRLLASGIKHDSEARLRAHIKVITTQRDGKGRWKHFPFHYTLLALSEAGLSDAVEELRYAALAFEESMRKQGSLEPKYARRRQRLLDNVLAMC